MLRSVDGYLVTDVSRQPTRLISKALWTLEYGADRLSRNADN